MKTIAIDKGNGDGWAVSDLLIPDDMATKLEKEYKSSSQFNFPLHNGKSDGLDDLGCYRPN